MANKRFPPASDFNSFLILYLHTRIENEITKKSDYLIHNYLFNINDKILARFWKTLFSGSNPEVFCNISKLIVWKLAPVFSDLSTVQPCLPKIII